MRGFRFRYAKALLLTPGIGSVVLCVVGLGLSLAVVRGWRRPAVVVRKAQVAVAPVVASRGVVVPMVANAAPVRVDRPVGVQRARVRRAIFATPLGKDQLGVLNEYAGRTVDEALREQPLRDVMNSVIPYAPFHYGIDMPLPQAVRVVMRGSEAPVAIRDGRYLTMTSERKTQGAVRAFVWIDMARGIALGAFYFRPSNGEPTPTLTLFSKQVMGGLDVRELPVAFVEDLGAWVATQELPTVTTRYFINGASEKTVLAHREDFCKAADAGDDCARRNVEAAEIDRAAADFLVKTHYAPNATGHMLASSN